MKVLIIDDEPTLRDLLSEFIASEGHEVVLAQTGQEGHEAFIEHRPEVIITDIFMPDMNGVDLIRNIRQRDKRVKIIAISGYQEELSTVQRYGVHATFVKPPDMAELMRLIGLIDRRAA